MTPCLSPVELILYYLSPAGGAAASTRSEHVVNCASCRTRLEALRRAVAAVPAGPSACLDEIALAELVDADSDQAVDVARVAHLAGCAHCRGELAALAALVRDPVVRAELHRPDWGFRTPAVVSLSRRRTRIAIGGLAAAASLLLAVRVLSPRRDAGETSGRLRHATIEAAAAPRLLAPVGAVARVDTMRWTAVAKADRYRVTLFNENGSIAWETEVADTFVAVPSAAAWAGRHSWRVKARTSFDRWVDSDFGQFTVGGGGR